MFNAASSPVTVIRVGSIPTRLTLATDAATVTNSAGPTVPELVPVTESTKLATNCNVVGTEIAMAKLTPLIVNPVAPVLIASLAITCAAVSPTT